MSGQGRGIPGKRVQGRAVSRQLRLVPPVEGRRECLAPTTPSIMQQSRRGVAVDNAVKTVENLSPRWISGALIRAQNVDF